MAVIRHKRTEPGRLPAYLSVPGFRLYPSDPIFGSSHLFAISLFAVNHIHTITTMTTLSPAKQAFIESAISHGVLLFGEFTLKSGRKSPYFFNAGLLYTSSLLASTASAFAQILAGEGTRIPSDFDVLFGPAYKGISLAAIAAVQVYRDYGKEVGYGYNRKEAKDVR